MKLCEELPQKDIKLLGHRLMDKDYSKEELKSLLSNIESDIVNCSTKNGDIDKMSNQYRDIINFLEANI